MESKYRLPILLFDENCPLCLRFKQALEALDRGNKLNFIPITDEGVYSRFKGINRIDCNDTVHLIDENEGIHKGPEVVHFLARFFPTVEKFAWLLDSQMGQKAVELFYDSINNFRKSKFGCEECKKSKL